MRAEHVEVGGEHVEADHNVAALHEAIAAAVPDRECLVAGGVRRTWAESSSKLRPQPSHERCWL